MFCYQCGEDGFASRRSLGNHVRYCNGCEVDDFLNPNRYYHNAASEPCRKRMMEKMEYTIHDKGVDPLSFLKKKQKVNNNNNSDAKLDEDSNDNILFEGASYLDHSEDDVEVEDVDEHEENDDEDNHNVHNPARMPKSFSRDPHVVHHSKIGLPNSHRFQIELAELFEKSRVPLQLYDDVINLLKDHSNGGQLNFSTDTLKDRAGMINKLEKIFESTPMKPEDINVQLSDETIATVSDPFHDLKKSCKSTCKFLL